MHFGPRLGAFLRLVTWTDKKQLMLHPPGTFRSWTTLGGLGMTQVTLPLSWSLAAGLALVWVKVSVCL